MPTLPPTDDEQDLQLAREGDREAFGRLYDRHARRVRAIVAAVSCDWPAVEDLTQETFLRAHQKLSRVRDPRHFGSWLDGIARRVALERRRALARDLHQYVGFQDEASHPEGRSEVADTRIGETENVMRSLAALPERERLAIHLHYFTNQNAPGSAGFLGLSRSGYYALLKRAIGQLRARLNPTVSDNRGGS